MDDKTHTPAAPEDDPAARQRANLLTLEIIFLAIIGLVTVAAFLEALSYKMVSARTPFVIMVPLLVLIAVRARRLFWVRNEARFADRLRAGLAGRIPGMTGVVAISAWMGIMLGLIIAVGHYIGILLFSFILMRVLARERLVLAILVSAISTGLIALLFEYGFNIEMYRGLLFRWMAGYRDFG